MRLLDRYIVREYVRALVGVGFIISVLMLVSIFLEHIDDIIESGAPLSTNLKWVVLQLPFQLVQAVPVIILLGVLLSIGGLARHNEIIAIVATGVSRARVFAPVLAVTGVCVVLTLLFSEFIVPRATEAAIYIRRVEIEHKPPPTEARETFVRGAADTYYWMDGYLDYSNRPRMVRPTILHLSPDRTFIEQRIDAQTAIHIRPNRPGTEPHWRFYGGTVWDFHPDGSVRQTESFRERRFDLEDDLTEFLSVRKKPEEMNYAELSRYIDVLSGRSGVDLDQYLTELHLKLAFPAGLLVVAMIAFPFAMRTRSGHLFAGFSLAITWIIAYYAFVAILRSFGHEGHLWPWLAAWAPDIVFGAAAAYQMSESRG